MRGLSRTWAIAVFEARQVRRMWRTWILGLVALGLPFLLGAQTFAVHRFFGGFSGSWAMVPEDVWVIQIGALASVTFGLVGIFLAFDWRHRDASQAFEATWDASGAGRLELAWGRFLGIALVLACFIAVQIAIVVALAIGFGIPLSPATFALAGLELTFLRALGMVAIAFGIAGLTGSRALAVVLSLGWLIGTFVTAFTAPEWVVVPLGGLTELPVHSDFIGHARAPLLGVQTLSVAALVAFFVTLGGLRRPGLPRHARERTLLGGAVAVLGLAWVAAMAGAWAIYDDALSDRRALVAAETAAAGLPAPVVTRRDLRVTIDPGDELAGEARLALRNDTDARLEVLPFRLDVGLEVLEVADEAGALDFEREESVVRVTPRRPVEVAEELDLTFRWTGRPVGTTVDAELALRRADLEATVRGNSRLGGGRGAIFESGAVALGMDAAWYPEPGVTFGHSPPSRRLRSFAPTSLRVEVPEGWTPASAGRRGRDGEAWTFTSDVPVPGVSLNAARYAEIEGEVAGITVRVLHHPDHSRNIEDFAIAADALRDWAAERLDDFEKRAGLRHPHEELTIVEVPQQLEPFAPGWDAGSQLGPPGVVMLRESTFFTTRFGFAFDTLRESYEERTGADAEGDGESEADGKGAPDGEGEGEAAPEGDGESESDGEDAVDAPAAESGDDGSVSVSINVGGDDETELSAFDEARVRVDMLRRYFQTDWTGGNVERLVVGHAWDHRLQAVGTGSVVLGPGLSDFIAERAMGVYTVSTPEYARIFNGPGFGRILNAFQNDREEEVAEILVSSIIDLDDVYELMQEVPLDELEPSEDPLSFVGLLFYKARKPLAAIHDTIGDDAFARVVERLLDEHAGEHFRWQDFRAAVLAEADAADRGALAALLDNWIEGTALPGFVVEENDVTAQRLAGEEERWQVFATVANVGEATGMARLRVGRGRDARSRLFLLPPGERRRVALVAPVAPQRWTLEPYLALNRSQPGGAVTASEDTLDAEPLEGVVDPPPLPPDREIVLDNVDAGFTVELGDGEHVQYAAVVEGATDPRLGRWRGFGKAREWSRWRTRGTWYAPHGTFDATAAVKTGTSEGGRPARWQVDGINPGTYRVEAHLPPGESPGRMVDLPEAYRFTVRGADGDREVVINLGAASAGWNELGRFSFDGEAIILLDDRGDGLIIADAVKLIPVGPSS